MRLDVSSWTEEGSHVLFDPALPFDLRVVERDLRAAFDREVEAGRALVLDAGDEEDSLGYAVLVDEPLPPDLAARVTRLAADVLLRAPDGRLLAGGVEELSIAEEEARSVTALALPAGDYLVDVHRTSFGQAELHAALRADPGTAAGFRRERWAGPVGGLLLLSGLLACLLGLTLGLRLGGGVRVWDDPDPATTAAALRAGGASLVGLLLLGLGFGWLRLVLPDEEYRRRKQAVAARLPGLVLHLRPAPPGHGARGARIDLSGVTHGRRRAHGPA